MLDLRTLKLAAVAIAFHALLLLALQSGLARRAVDAALRQAVIAELFAPAPEPAPPAPRAEPPRVPAPPTAVRITRSAPARRAPTPVASVPLRPAPEDALRPEAVDTVRPEPGPVAPAGDAAQVPSSQGQAVRAQVDAGAQGASAQPDAAARQTSAAPRVVTLGEIRCSTPEPRYPLISRRLGEQGAVRVRLLIDEAGAIAKAEVISSSGFERLDKVALDAAQQTRCNPYLVDGRAMRVTAVRPFAFRLD